MVMLVILIVGAAAILVNSLSSTALRTERDKITTASLAQAKESLLGRAVSDANRPGSLPCPDINNDGISDSSGTSCDKYIGRLPWKTLGLDDPRDGTGERLWYVLSFNFADIPSNKINSNSNGTLLVYDNSGTTLLTQPGSEAVAIIFAPGTVVSSQQRNSAVDKTTASNYLDIGPNTINNSIAAGPFIAADKTGTFNDGLVIIKTSDLMPIVEIRVLKELSKAFASYMANNSGKYPYPADLNSCTSITSTYCNSDTTQCVGKIPILTMSSVLTSMPWFANNNWLDVIYYAAGTNSLSIGAGGGWGGGKTFRSTKGGGSWIGSGGSGSTICTATSLTILDTNGGTLTTNANALFLMPGSSLTGATRGSMSTSNLAYFFEDPENKNLDYSYVLPGGTSNDTLNILP